MATPLGTLTLDLIAKTGGFTEPMKKAGDTAERESKRIEKSTGSALEMIKGLGATALAGFTVGTVISMADEYSQMAAQIRNATSSQQEYDQVQKHLLETANTTYRSLKEAQQVYLDVGGALKAYGETTERSLRITDSLSFSFTHNATQADKAASATDAYMKSIYSGTVSGDAWASILSAIPSIVSDLSKSLNKSEADILSMGNAGKLSSKDLNNALDASREKSEALANSMSNSLQDGLNNARNGFVVLAGEINETFGVTNAMAGSLGIVGETAKLAADNLEVVTKVLGIGTAFILGSHIPALVSATGAGYARTKQIVEQTAIQYAAINAERAAAATSLAQAEAQLVNTQSTLAALAAEKALEVQRLKEQINNIGRVASATRMAQLRQIEVQVTAELTAAETALAAARARSTAASAAGLGVGRAALGLLLGPVGLGLAVATVAGGYLLMKDNAEKATASINTQGKSVADLVLKYRELNTLQRDNEAKALADQIEDLGLKYRVASSDLYSFMEALPVSDEKIATFSKLNSELSQGRMTSDEYYQAVKNVNILTDDQLSKVRGLLGGYVEAKSKFKDAETAQNAFKTALNGVTGEVKKQASEVAVLSEELKKLLEDNSVVAYKNNLVGSIVSSAKVDPKLAEYIYEMRKAAGILGTGKSLTEDQLKSVRERWQSEKNLNKTIDERNKLEEKNKKLVEAQGNAMKVNALVASNALKANATALESEKNLPKGLLSAVNMVESPRSNFATSGAGAGGPMQFMPATADRYKVDIKSVESSYRGASNYLKDLLKMFDGDIENALRAYNWGEGNMQNYLKYGSGMKGGKKGYFPDKPMPKETREYSGKVMGFMGGASGVSFTEGYSYDDWLKEQEKFSIERERREKEQAAKQLDLTNAVATEKVRINTKLAQDIKSIEEAGFPESESKKLIAEYQRRADIDIQIADAAQIDKLSSFSDYAKSEEQLLNESYARRQRDLKLDISLTIGAYTEASAHLEKQRVMEQSALQISQQKQLLEVKKTWMSSADYARDYYALVREEILNTANYSPEMKDVLIKQVIIQQGVEENAEREQVWGDYQNRFGVEDSPYQQDIDLLDKALKHKLFLEEDYQRKRREVQLVHGGAYAADFAGLMMNLVDTNDWAYRDLALAQKGFTLFSVAMSSYDTIAKAWSSFPFPANLPVVAQAVMQTGLLQAAVSAMTPAGFADGGFTGYGGKYDVAGVVHRGEGVLTQEEIAALGGPAGFYALREAIKNGYADGGMVLDPPKVFTPQTSKIDAYAGQSQQSSSNGMQGLTIINQIEQDDLVGGYFRKPAAGQLILNLIKASPSEFKRAMGV